MAATVTISPVGPYTKGQALTLTVTDAPRKSTPASQEVDNITVTNPDTNAVIYTGQIKGQPIAGVPAKPFGVVDDSGRAWTQKSDDGTTEVLTGTF